MRRPGKLTLAGIQRDADGQLWAQWRRLDGQLECVRITEQQLISIARRQALLGRPMPEIVGHLPDLDDAA